MRNNTIRVALALMAFVGVARWSRPAAADVTVTGTVGQIVVQTYIAKNGNAFSLLQFNFTDVNQTKGCVPSGNVQWGATAPPANMAVLCVAGQNCGNYDYYAPFYAYVYKEIYAELLISKKGATITCNLVDKNLCLVTGCTLQ